MPALSNDAEILLPCSKLPTDPCTGYLNSCTLWIDSDGDGQRGPGEPSASTVNGAFSFPPTPASRMGALFIEPADEDTRQVGMPL
jgi:hypothetical protein